MPSARRTWTARSPRPCWPTPTACSPRRRRSMPRRSSPRRSPDGCPIRSPFLRTCADRHVVLAHRGQPCRRPSCLAWAHAANPVLVCAHLLPYPLGLSVQLAVLAVVPEQVGGVGTRPFLAVGPVGLLGGTAGGGG